MLGSRQEMHEWVSAPPVNKEPRLSVSRAQGHLVKSKAFTPSQPPILGSHCPLLARLQQRDICFLRSFKTFCWRVRLVKKKLSFGCAKISFSMPYTYWSWLCPLRLPRTRLSPCFPMAPWRLENSDPGPLKSSISVHPLSSSSS